MSVFTERYDPNL